MFATRVFEGSNTGVESHYKTRLQSHEKKGKLFGTTEGPSSVARQSRVAEPVNGSLDDLHVLVNGTTADTNTTNEVIVLVDGETTAKDNKTTVGLFDTCRI